MPRKRHDTSSDDSDSSEEEVRSSKRGDRSQQEQASNGRQRVSSQKSSRRDQTARRKVNSDGDSSLDRSRDRQQFSSDSDESPVKRSVVTKVEKPNTGPSRGRNDRSLDRSKGARDDRRNARGSDVGQRSDWRNEAVGGRISPDRKRRNSSLSPPDRDQVDYRDRNEFRSDARRRSVSPDRRSGPRRNDNQNLNKRSRSPLHGQGWKGRGQGYRNTQPSRSLERQDDRFSSQGRDFSDRNRPIRDRSMSPARNRNRNDSDVSFERRNISPEQVPDRQRGRRSPSPLRSNRSRRSLSSARSGRGNQLDDTLSSSSPVKSKSKGSKSKKSKQNSDRSLIDSDEELKTSEVSKKGKKKKKKDFEKDDSLERSFERSKQLLEESAHSRDFEVSMSDDLNDGPSPVKGQKKSKRQREYSESDQEVVAKKSKKSKTGRDESNKINLKKTKKNKRMSMSPSRREKDSEKKSRSFESDRSRSSERSFGRHHDMDQFESEPESGEITDSEEDGNKGRQSMKSLINRPQEEGETPSMEDERYLNQKRKASRMKAREKSKKKDEKKEGGKEKGSKRKEEEPKEPESVHEVKKAKPAAVGIEALTGRTGGAYIPPARLRAMQAKITDKSSVEYQRISWEALKKSINGLVNKVNVGNIEHIVRELFQENIVRGRGLMARSIIQAQAASPTFTHVYAALVSIVNTKFPQNGELILRRLILQFRRGYKRNDKSICMSATRFVAHLVNQQVAHEVLALEILTLLLETPTDDSVEVAIGFLKECGQKLTEVTPRGINAIFERLRNVLHEGQIDIRVQYMMEVMFAVRKDHFKDYPSVVTELDLVEEEDQFTHLLTLEDAVNGEEILNVFKADPAFEENEEKYKILKKEILGEGSSDEEGSGSGSGSDSDEEEESEEDEEAKQTIIDQTETNMVALRRAIYLTIQSSLDFEECAHKLMKMELKPGQEVELCSMILDCCAQMRTYEKFFGLLAGRFCMINKKYVEPFQLMFKEQYDTIHRLETNKLRNVAKFFAHLLHTDSISWAVLQAIRLNEDDTTSASRIFIKILFQELSEYLGLPKLNERLKDPTLQEYYSGLLPRDNPRDTRFAINFFTTIGLGGLTDDLRDHLKDVSQKLIQQKQEEQAAAMQAESDDDSSDDSSDDSDQSDDSDSSSSSSESESSEDDRRKKKNDRKKKSAVEKERKTRDKPVKEKQKNREKEGRKNRDATNGSFEKRGRNEIEKLSKKDRKKNKKDGQRMQKTEEEMRQEQAQQFKKLAKLANYDNVNEIDDSFQSDKGRGANERKKSKKDKKEKNREKKSKTRSEVSEDENLEDEALGTRPRVIDHRTKGFDAREYADRSYAGGYNRGGRGGGFVGGDRRFRGEGGGGVFDDRMRGGRMKDRGSGKKGRDFIDDDFDDRGDVRIERNFERMDLYEEKFEKERERNLEQVRGREEFQDYYRVREGGDSIRGGSYRGREGPFRGDRELERFPVGDRVYEDERKRGGNRSEERLSERRRRR